MPVMMESRLLVMPLDVLRMLGQARRTPFHVGEFPNLQQLTDKTKSAIFGCAGATKNILIEDGLTVVWYDQQAPITEE